MWLFIHLMRPLLSFIDTFIQEGVLFDTKNELGFKRNPNVSINSVDYWCTGYQQVLTPCLNLPLFMRILLASSFKICKQMEIINLLGNLNSKANVYQTFCSKIKSTCPYLISNSQSLIENVQEGQEKSSLLEINFKKLDSNLKSNNLKYFLVSIEELFKLDVKSELVFNLEEKIEQFLNDSLVDYINYSSKSLIENLFQKYHMKEFFSFIHSYYLFISNEVIFLFSKKLFELVKSYETYQEDAVLNNLFYNSASSVFTTDLQVNFNFNLVSLHYDTQMMISNEQTGLNNSRLINSIRIKMKILWPLNIIISQTDLDTYNRIFLFLLQIKQVKYELERLDWHDLDLDVFSKSVYGKKKSFKGAEKVNQVLVKKMYLMRSSLLNFINNAHNLISDQVSI